MLLAGRASGAASPAPLCAGFTISIPFFNTTLSRVNRLEIAAVVEVLLSLRCCRPRNIEPPIARNLRLDIVTIVKHMAAAPRDSTSAPPATLVRAACRDCCCVALCGAPPAWH